MKKLSHKSLAFKKAFSLIEISVVILIIGILIAGITQSSILVKNFRLSSAEALTNSSPVASISGLSVWFETTSEKSFDSTVQEGSSYNKIATWYDINPQTITKINASQVTDANKPTYVTEKSSGLPMVYFNGSSSYLDLPDSTVPYGNNSYTVFIVANVLANAIYDKTFLSAETVANVNFNIFRFRDNSEFHSLFSGSVSNDNYFNGLQTDKLNILVASRGTSSVANVSTKVYANGRSGSSDYNASVTTGPQINNTIGIRKNAGGTSDQMYGYIGEIIIFNRVLNDEERKSVEQYLGKKWKIAVS